MLAIEIHLLTFRFCLDDRRNQRVRMRIFLPVIPLLVIIYFRVYVI